MLEFILFTTFQVSGPNFNAKHFHGLLQIEGKVQMPKTHGTFNNMFKLMCIFESWLCSHQSSSLLEWTVRRRLKGVTSELRWEEDQSNSQCKGRKGWEWACNDQSWEKGQCKWAGSAFKRRLGPDITGLWSPGEETDLWWGTMRTIGDINRGWHWSDFRFYKIAPAAVRQRVQDWGQQEVCQKVPHHLPWSRGERWGVA